jgi:5'-methylthioinosine phosphorylase
MLAIIGGTGLTEMHGLEVVDHLEITTRYGTSSAPILKGSVGNNEILFLARHGNPHHKLPHQVNYRGNIAALKEAGATSIIAVNAVGGIAQQCRIGAIVVPDQLIDYTHGRDSTFFDNPAQDGLIHVDFTWPFDNKLRLALMESLDNQNVEYVNGATYGATQGPRLETAAEIIRMENDGCDIVGMTGMPEAVLAREVDVPYVMLSLVVNPAAGKSDREITMDEIQQVLDSGMVKIRQCLAEFADSQR